MKQKITFYKFTAFMINIFLLLSFLSAGALPVSAVTGIPGESALNPATTTDELKNALASAADGDTIYIGPYTITLEDTITITKSITLKGADKEDTVLKCPAAGGRHFIIDSNIACIFEDMTLRGSGKPSAVAAKENGGVRATANMQKKLVFNRCIVSDNINNASSTTGNGGAVSILSANASLETTDCIINNNSSGAGGALCIYGSAAMTNCILSSNTTTGNGGAVFVMDTAMLTGCTLSNNITSVSGGGLYAYKFATIKNCEISGNTSNGGGGGAGLYINAGGTITSCSIVNNKSNATGGGAYVMESATFVNCTISGNSATSTGGGLRGYSGTSHVEAISCTISGNTASGGGGIYGANVVNAYGCMISGNYHRVDGTENNVTLALAWPASEPTENWPVQTPSSENHYNIIGTPTGTLSDIMESEVKLIALKNLPVGKLSNGVIFPSATSIAIDGVQNTSGWPTVPATDQRGILRPQGTKLDIGAVEMEMETAKVLVTDITLIPNPLVMDVDEGPQTITAVVSPDNADIKTLTWESSDPSIAEVDQNGLVTPIATGSCIVTARAQDGSGVTGAAVVRVVQRITGIAINEGPIALNKGETTKFTATVTPPGYTTTNPVTWQSSDDSVAVVDENGVVTATGAGTASITCRIIDSDNNDKEWISQPVMVRVLEVLQPISADPMQNKIILTSDTVLAKKFTFMAIGDRQYASGVVAGDERYIPQSWNINPHGEFPESGPYTGSATIEKPGLYTLSATFILQRFDGNVWVSTDMEDTKTLDIEFKEIQTPEQIPKTGGDSVGDIMPLLFIASSLMLFIIVYTKKRKIKQ